MYFSFLIELSVLSKQEDPDQMPHFAASDQGLHLLSMSHKKDTRLIWINPLYSDGFSLAWVPGYIDTINMGLPCAYCVLVGVTGRLLNYEVYPSLNNSKQCRPTFHLGFHCLSKYPFRSFQYTKDELCILGNYECFLSSADFFQNQLFLKNSFRNIIRVSNSLDPDQARQNVWPDLFAKVISRRHQ